MSMVMNIGNVFVAAILRSPLHRLLGDRIALITVRGVVSGKTYTTPVNVLCSGDQASIVSARSRTWWRNLRGGAEAQLLLAGQRYAAAGRVLEREVEVVEGLTAHLSLAPEMAKYLGIKVDEQGGMDADDLKREAASRVVIQLTLNEL